MRYIEMVRITLSFFILCSCIAVFGQSGKADKGAFILISTEGEVRYLKQSGEQASPVKVGTAIPPSYSVETGATGKVVGLLSNGTLLTLTENTRMKVSTFEQEPFEDDGRKLADLPGEPSQSKVTLDLDFGSLVVKTKKLNKGSTFDINSPVGVAGIRGTEFQMASAPGQGVQLDVTESTVAFTPPGGGQPIPVSQGNGLSVSPSGVATQRPVNPVVATKIESTNQAATEATQDVSLGEVAVAVEQSAQESESASGESEGDAPSEESAESETEGDAPAEESQEAVESEEATKEESQSTDGAVEEGTGTEQSSSDTKGEQSTSSQPDIAGEKQGDTPGVGSKKQAGQGQQNTQQKVEVQQPDKSQLLENNPELKKNQKLSRYGLSSEELARYDRLSGLALDQIEQESPGVVKRLLGIDGFEGEKSRLFFQHDREMRDLLLGMSDEVLITMLDPEVDPVLLRESLQKISQGVVKPGDVPTVGPDLGANSRAIALGDRLRENGNGELMEELLEMSDGLLDDQWLRVGEVAEALTRNLELVEYSELEGFSREESLGNPFFPELANVYDQLEVDGLVNGAQLVMGADNLIVKENAQAFGSHFSQGVDEIVLMSREAMEFRGDFTWEAPQRAGTRLVLMSADNFMVKEGASLRSATSDLVIATRQNLLLKQVEVEAAREVSIRGMQDVTLNQVKIGADELARIKARRDLTVDGLGFKRDVSRIVMEATTIRLSNVDFPAASQVRLNSLKGAIDGRYPNFGKTIPAAQQIGRVNFIENVKSGGNLLHNRPSFDLHGKNITIGKIARP